MNPINAAEVAAQCHALAHEIRTGREAQAAARVFKPHIVRILCDAIADAAAWTEAHGNAPPLLMPESGWSRHERVLHAPPAKTKYADEDWRVHHLLHGSIALMHTKPEGHKAADHIAWVLRYVLTHRIKPRTTRQPQPRPTP